MWFKKQCLYQPQALIFNAINETEEKEEQQCNIVANYAIVTILMGSCPAAETPKVLLKSVIIFIYYPQTINETTKYSITLRMYWGIYQTQTEE